MLKLRYLLFLICLLTFPLESVCVHGPHFVSLGPEAYYIKRNKKGGSWQDGWLYGVRCNYEKLRDRGLYLCADGYWATGKLSGSSRTGGTLKSKVTEHGVEGRLGFSYSFPKSICTTWVPYIAYGQFVSHNDFVDPTPLTYKSKSEFRYYACGGMLLISLNRCWNAGLHFKYVQPEEPTCKIENDPDYGTVLLNMGIKPQYEAELPVRYRTRWSNREVGLLIAPFFRLRHFGQQANFPSDYTETRFHIWGVRALAQVIF